MHEAEIVRHVMSQVETNNPSEDEKMNEFSFCARQVSETIPCGQRASKGHCSMIASFKLRLRDSDSVTAIVIVVIIVIVNVTTRRHSCVRSGNADLAPGS